jgi:DNA primase
MIPNETVQLILDTAKIEEVVGDFVQLKKRGINLLGLCPFHHEKTPSFTVAPAKNIFKCFGCGEGGNSVNFVMKHEQLSYPEALRYLANKYGIEVKEEETTEEYRQEQQLADSLYLVNQFAQEYYAKQLFQTDYGKSVGLSYFKERGFREDIIQRFGLGFALGSQNDFTKEAIRKQYKPELLQKAGLMTSNANDFFRQRVMFPFYNLSGKIVGFGGRILVNDKKQPKYLNTPETEVYQKSKLLYGIYFAKKSILQKDNCFLVEGYTDVISLHQGGLENTVASSGTSLTVGQILLIKRYTSNITILYDGDAAGIKAALRGLDLVLEQDMNVRVVLLPDGEDPDSYMKKMGATVFEEFVKNQSKDFILFKTQLLLKDTKEDPIGRAEVLKDIVQSITKVPDALKRAAYVRSCAQLLEVSEQLLHNEVNRRLQAQQPKGKGGAAQSVSDRSQTTGEFNTPIDPQAEDPSKSTVHPTQALRSDLYQERDLVRVLMQFGDKPFTEAETVGEFLILSLLEVDDQLHQLFEHELYGKVASLYLEALSEGRHLDLNFFLEHPDLSIQQLAINFSVSPYQYSPGWEKFNVYLTSQKMPEENFVSDCRSVLNRFKLKKIDRAIQRNGHEIKQQGENFEEVLRLLKVQKHLMSLRNALTKAVILK